MSQRRDIALPEKDQPLRADISLLGSLIGDVLVDQHGPDLLEAVEAVRKAAIREQNQGTDGELQAILAGLGNERVLQVIKAFTTYLRSANLAEKVHRIRRRRVHQRAGDTHQRGSLEAVFAELAEAGVDHNTVATAVESLSIQPVFTAHPTEATRRTVQEKEYDMVLRMVERLNPNLTPDEETVVMNRLRAALTSAWQTRLAPEKKPAVADELDNILFYLTDILYRVVPPFYEAIEKAYRAEFGEPPADFLKRNVLRFGSWVGGDMDGNPNVTAETILATLARQRQVIVKRYIPEVRYLGRYLSQSLNQIGISEAVQQQVARYREMMPDVSRSIPERHDDMPYRCMLKFIAARLEATAADGEHRYHSKDDLLGDITLMRESLAENRGQHAGMFGVNRLRRRISTFGFHLATLDVRQDALLHRQVIGELLGCEDWEERDAENRTAVLDHLIAEGGLPEVAHESGLSDNARSTLAVFRAISSARQQYGSGAIGLFIVSMTQGADDVLSVLALAEIANPHTGAASQIDVAPLLETVDDLQAGPGIMRTLLACKTYRQHLRHLGDRQVVMIGYSDSSKDSGIVASRWNLHHAQQQLVDVGDARSIDVVFFHGRGGTVSRGGGSLVGGIAGAPPNTIRGFLRLTEQGEVINQKYGVRSLALRNLELVSGATLKHDLDVGVRSMEGWEHEILSYMAERSRQHFRDLVYGDENFPLFFRAATPIDVIERLNIGSRPASRRSGVGIENLRAIPWVFSWAQVRVGFPGVYGFGTALDASIREFGLENIRKLLNNQVFFQAMVNDVEMVLGKSVMDLGHRYAGLANDEHAYVFTRICDEFALAERRILELKGLDQLLDDQPMLQRNIKLRNPYVAPLHLLQIDLLKKWRASGREDEAILEPLKGTVKGIALGIQNTG